jgi:hypothetical protein
MEYVYSPYMAKAASCSEVKTYTQLKYNRDIWSIKQQVNLILYLSVTLGNGYSKLTFLPSSQNSPLIHLYHAYGPAQPLTDSYTKNNKHINPLSK